MWNRTLVARWILSDDELMASLFLILFFEDQELHQLAGLRSPYRKAFPTRDENRLRRGNRAIQSHTRMAPY